MRFPRLASVVQLVVDMLAILIDWAQEERAE